MLHWARASAKKAFSAMGMDKAAAQSIGSASVWVTLDNWVVRAGFPDTVIAGNGMVMNGSGNIQTTYVVGASSGNVQFRVVKNGSVVVDGPTSLMSSPLTRTSATFAVVAGDVLTLQANNVFANISITSAAFITTIIP